MMMRGRVAIAAAGLVLGFGFSSSAQAAGKGEVDWSNKVVKATGKGAPNLRAANITVARLGAEKAAKLDAMRNLLETLKGVEVRSGESVGGIIESNSAVKAKVQGVLRNFRIVATRYFSDGGVEVDVEMKLDGDLTSAVIPKKAAASGACSGGTTGLVVDASGTGVVPALAPRLLDASGKEVVATSMLEPGAASDRGVAAYARSVDEAKKNARVGCSPLVVKATKAKGSDVVLALDVASKIRGAAKNHPFLEEGRIMIVAD